jgi:hypothetical protein
LNVQLENLQGGDSNKQHGTRYEQCILDRRFDEQRE